MGFRYQEFQRSGGPLIWNFSHGRILAQIVLPNQCFIIRPTDFTFFLIYGFYLWPWPHQTFLFLFKNSLTIQFIDCLVYAVQGQNKYVSIYKLAQTSPQYRIAFLENSTLNAITSLIKFFLLPNFVLVHSHATDLSLTHKWTSLVAARMNLK